MKIFFFTSFIISSLIVFAQNRTIPYSKDFDFKEGIYLSFTDFKNNHPIPKAAIVAAGNKDDLNFLYELVQKDNFTYKDTAGKDYKVQIKDIWGYAQNRGIYIQMNRDFNRLNIIGSICSLTATFTTYSNRADPMIYGSSISVPYQQILQYIIDMETGLAMDFNAANLEIILQRDEILYKEFNALSKRKKGDQKFVYLRKYNEKHPLYVPVD